MNSTEERIRIPHLRVVSEDRRSQFSAQRCGSCILLLSIQSQIVAVQPNHPCRNFTRSSFHVKRTRCLLLQRPFVAMSKLTLFGSAVIYYCAEHRDYRGRKRDSQFRGLGSLCTHSCSLPCSACRTTSWIVRCRKLYPRHMCMLVCLSAKGHVLWNAKLSVLGEAPK